MLDKIQNYEKPKISVIMQVFLGDYPGARSNPLYKFKRAISSFKNQTYTNCELIIVADGCELAMKVYEEEFKDDPNIHFIYVDKKSGPRMYEEQDTGGKNEIYYRGIPRKIGVSMATGDLITYMDGDDYILPNHLSSIIIVYNQAKECDWWINASWYEHASIDWPETSYAYTTKGAVEYEFKELPGEKWNKIKLKPGIFILGTVLTTHRSSCKTEWRDTTGESEDVDFYKRLRSEYPNGIAFEMPTYIKCHMRGAWDV